MKKTATILSAIASALLIFVLLVTMLQVVMKDESFIQNEYTELGLSSTMGISNLDLVRSYMRLIDYMEGTVSTIDIEVTLNGEPVKMFEQEQERVHMADVRLLWQTVRSIRDYSILAVLVLYLVAVLMGFHDAARTLSTGYLYGFFLCLLVFGFFGTWALMDFSSFWTMFHESLFWNDLWLFDPGESRMINMLPEAIFAHIARNAAIYTAVAALALMGVAIFCLLRLKKKKAERIAERERRRQIKERKAQGLPIGDELLSKEQKKKKAQREKERKRREAMLEKKKKQAEQAKLKAEKAAEKARKQAALEAEKEERKKAEKAAAAEKAAKARREKDPEQAELLDEGWIDSSDQTGEEKPKKRAEKATGKRIAGKKAAGKAKAPKRNKKDPFELVLPEEWEDLPENENQEAEDDLF